MCCFNSKKLFRVLKFLEKVSLLSTISIKNSSPFYRKNCKNSKIAQKFPFSTIFINYPKLSFAHFSNTFKRYSSFIPFSLFLRHGILITVNPDKQTLSPKTSSPLAAKPQTRKISSKNPFTSKPLPLKKIQIRSIIETMNGIIDGPSAIAPCFLSTALNASLTAPPLSTLLCLRRSR